MANVVLKIPDELLELAEIRRSVSRLAQDARLIEEQIGHHLDRHIERLNLTDEEKHVFMAEFFAIAERSTQVT